MGTLYVVATPIGNLEELSPRAARVLREVTVIAAEDTRHTGQLLKRAGISTPMISYHAFNERSRVEDLMARLQTGDVALVSDAGTPAISDPGSHLVRAAIDAGFPVSPVAGPSSLAAAMSVSGFADGTSLFLGFLSRNRRERQEQLNRALDTGYAVFLFESPKRTVQTVREISAIDPQRELAIFRELTKLHEEILRGTTTELATHLQNSGDIRGEVVIGIAGAPSRAPASLDADTELKVRLEAGMSVTDAAKEVARLTNVPKSALYDRALELRGAKNSGSGQPD